MAMLRLHMAHTADRAPPSVGMEEGRQGGGWWCLHIFKETLTMGLDPHQEWARVPVCTGGGGMGRFHSLQASAERHKNN